MGWAVLFACRFGNGRQCRMSCLQITRTELCICEKQTILYADGAGCTCVPGGEGGGFVQDPNCLPVVIQDPQRPSVVAHCGCNGSRVSRELAFVRDRTLELLPRSPDLPCAQLQCAHIAEDDLGIEGISHPDGAIDVDGFPISGLCNVKPVGSCQADGEREVEDRGLAIVAAGVGVVFVFCRVAC